MPWDVILRSRAPLQPLLLPLLPLLPGVRVWGGGGTHHTQQPTHATRVAPDAVPTSAFSCFQNTFRLCASHVRLCVHTCCLHLLTHPPPPPPPPTHTSTTCGNAYKRHSAMPWVALTLHTCLLDTLCTLPGPLYMHCCTCRAIQFNSGGPAAPVHAVAAWWHQSVAALAVVQQQCQRL